MKRLLSRSLLIWVLPVALLVLFPSDRILAQHNMLGGDRDYLEDILAGTSRAPQFLDTSLQDVGQWGWGRCMGAASMGNYVFTGSGPSFLWVDVTDKRNPVVVWDTLSNLQVWNQIIQDSIGYALAADRFVVLDFRDPALPHIMSELNIDNAWAFVVEDSLAFVRDFSYLHCIDVSNPSSPYVRSTLFSWPEVPWMTISKKRLYIADAHGDATEYIDASDPDSMRVTILQGLPRANSAICARDSILLVGSHGHLEIYSIAIPDSPALLSRTLIPNGIGTLALQGDTVHIEIEDGGVIEVDITNRSQPVVLGEYVPSGHLRQNVWSLAVMDTVLYCSLPHGVNVLSVANPSNVHPVSFIPTGHQSNKVVVRDGLAYVTSGLAGLWVVDVSNPVHPRRLGYVHTFGYARDLIADSAVAYVSASDELEAWSDDPWNGVVAIDIRRPDSLRVLDSIAMGRAFTMAKSGGLLFVACPADSTVTILDVGDPTNIRQIGSLDDGYMAIEIAARDSIVFLASGSAGLRIVDSRDPIHPQLLCSILPGAYGVCLDGDYAYVFSRREGFPVPHDSIVVLNISDPASPSIVAKAHKFVDGSRWSGPLESVVANNLLLWAGDNELGICDVTNPAQPRVTFAYRIEYLYGIDAVSDTIYFTHSYWGLWMIRYDRGPNAVGGHNDPSVKTFHVYPNYPNPFNASTQLKFVAGARQQVRIEVFNILGQHVATAFDGMVEAGEHKVHFNASHLPSGVYFYRLTAKDAALIGRMVLVK